MCHPLVDQAYLRLSSLKTIFEGFLSACWSQREAGRSQRQAEARAACILEGQDDQLIDELRRLDSYIKEGRVEVEKWKDFALQSARNMSSWMTLLRLHRYRAFWRLMLYKVVGTGPWTEANVYITYIYIHLYVLSQWLVVLKKGVPMCCPLYVQFFHSYLISSEYIHCCEIYCMLLHQMAVPWRPSIPSWQEVILQTMQVEAPKYPLTNW